VSETGEVGMTEITQEMIDITQRGRDSFKEELHHLDSLTADEWDWRLRVIAMSRRQLRLKHDQEIVELALQMTEEALVSDDVTAFISNTKENDDEKSEPRSPASSPSAISEVELLRDLEQVATDILMTILSHEALTGKPTSKYPIRHSLVRRLHKAVAALQDAPLPRCAERTSDGK